MSTLLASAYFGPISYFAHVVQSKDVLIEQHEHFNKQTYRNRCNILGPNGVQSLLVPIQKKGGKQPIKEVQISYAENWPDLHWRSLKTAYGSSPFFEILGPDVEALLKSKPNFLLDLNLKSVALVLQWLEADVNLELTDAFKAPIEGDLRFSIHPKSTPVVSTPSYFQVFTHDKKAVDLSVLDLLFNQGSVAWDYLQNIAL